LPLPNGGVKATDMVLRRLLQLLGGSFGQGAENGADAAGPAAHPPAGGDVEFDRNKLPAGAREKVAQVLSLLVELEERCAARRGMGPFDELERIRTVHLPRLIQSYIDIPPEHRAEVFRETGRSASYILVDQLEKLLARLREISKMIAQGDVDAFTQNVRFIDMQYGSSFDLD